MTTRPIVSAVTITLWTNRRPPRIHAPPTADNRLERISSNSIIIIVTTQGWRWNSTEISNTRRTRDDIFRAGLETRYLYIYIYWSDNTRMSRSLIEWKCAVDESSPSRPSMNLWYYRIVSDQSFTRYGPRLRCCTPMVLYKYVPRDKYFTFGPRVKRI